MDDLISIIVPVFNAEHTLQRCIKSIQNQSYSHFELLIVDDGSVDNSKRIIEDAQHNDKRIKYIYKKNTGVSDTRNIGMNAACGKYICFIDADDWVKDDYLEKMYKAIKKTGADIATCGHFRVEYTKQTPVYSFSGKTYSSDEAIVELLSMGKIGNAIWDKMFKSDIVRLYPFPSKQIVNEELFVLLNAFSKAQSVVNCGEPLYYYCFNPSSASQTYTIEKAKTVISNLRKIGLWASSCSNEIKKAARQYRAYFENAVLINLVRYDLNLEDSSFYLRLQDELKKDFMFILNNQNVDIIMKIKAMANCLGLYTIAYRLMRKNDK